MHAASLLCQKSVRFKHMHKYILKRLLWLVPIILGVAVLVFTLMYFCPGDPAEIILGAGASDAEKEYLRISLGLNDPFLIRLGRFLKDTFIRFDFGRSWITNMSIAESIAERLPRTMLLAAAIMLLSVTVGIPLGVVAATHQNGWQDNLCMALALLGVSVPSFWMALLLIIVFSIKLDLLPPMGIGGIQYYILPALAGCTGGIAALARQTRSSMLDVIRSDYITTARSKGVSESRVITKHALKNALIPIITIVGTQFGRLLGGTMILETIFGIPGLGSYIVSGVSNRDYPVVMIGSIVLAVMFSLCMLGVDLIYAAVDPRIKAQYAKKR